MNAGVRRADSLLRFVEAIAPCGLTSEEIAEALWLAARTQGLGAGAEAGTDAQDDRSPAGVAPERPTAGERVPAGNRNQVPVSTVPGARADR